MNRDKKITNIIEALGRKKDIESIQVLEEVGTNCDENEVRRLTARALINKNCEEALEVVILRDGKGINDLNTSVAMSTINDLLALDDKEHALRVLTRAEEEEDYAKTIKETARSVKALMTFAS